MVGFLTIQDMDQEVNFATHIHVNGLDWIMCESTSNITNITNISEGDFLLHCMTNDFTLSVQNKQLKGLIFQLGASRLLIVQFLTWTTWLMSMT